MPARAKVTARWAARITSSAAMASGPVRPNVVGSETSTTSYGPSDAGVSEIMDAMLPIETIVSTASGLTGNPRPR